MIFKPRNTKKEVWFNPFSIGPFWSPLKNIRKSVVGYGDENTMSQVFSNCLLLRWAGGNRNAKMSFLRKRRNNQTWYIHATALSL